MRYNETASRFQRIDGMKLKLQYLLTISIMLTALLNLQAQDNKQEPEILKLDTSLVSIEVNINSKTSSKNIAGLTAQDFTVYEDGVKQKVENFASTESPFNLVLMVDTSGSARDEVDLMKKAAKRFLNEMRPQDRIGIVELNQRITVMEGLTSDREKIESAIDFLQPGTGTSFYDALQITLDEVLSKADGRKAVIVLTDGVDSVGAATFDEILPEIERSKVTTYFLEVNTEAKTESGMMLNCEDEKSFHFSRKQLKKYVAEYAEGLDDTRYENHCELSKLERMQINRRLYESARKELREMASQTGGKVYPCKRLAELEPAYSQIAAELRTQYSIGYYPTNEKHDGKWRTIKIEMKKPGLTAKTKPGYRAPEE